MLVTLAEVGFSNLEEDRVSWLAFFSVLLESKSRTLHILGKHSTTELDP